jgi:hypothetical protein
MLISILLHAPQIKSGLQQRTTSKASKSFNSGTTFSVMVRLEFDHDLISLFKRDLFATDGFPVSKPGH